MFYITITSKGGFDAIFFIKSLKFTIFASDFSIVNVNNKNSARFPDDESIVKAVRKGDPQVFSYLFDVYYVNLVMYASTFCHSKATCEDIVQDLFVDLYLHRGKFDPHSSVKAWFLTCVRNRCLDELRHRKVRVKHADYVLRYGLKVSENAEEHLFYSDLKECLERAMVRLTDQERTCFTLSRIDGMTTKEISERLKMPLRTVQYHISAALRKIMHEIPSLLTGLALFFALNSLSNVII